MHMGIHKPGQGYWTRVLTAIGCAIAFGAMALWAWSQASLIPIPTPTYELTLGQVDGAIETGQVVTLVGEGVTGGELVEIGNGVVESVDQGQGSVELADVGVPGEDRSVTDTTRLELASGDTVRVAAVRGVPLFEQLYLQAGAAGVIVLIGALVTYYYVGVNRRTTEFLIATDNEMKKVNWSTRRDVIGSTWVVIAASFLLATGLFVVDMFFSMFFRWVGVLTG